MAATTVARYEMGLAQETSTRLLGQRYAFSLLCFFYFYFIPTKFPVQPSRVTYPPATSPPSAASPPPPPSSPGQGHEQQQEQQQGQQVQQEPPTPAALETLLRCEPRCFFFLLIFIHDHRNHQRNTR
jgi:hypothetical protein